MSKSVLVRLGIYALDYGLSAFFGLVLLVLVAQGDDLDNFGTFAMALAIASLQTPLAVLGIAALFYGRATSRPVSANRLYWPGVYVALVSGTLLYALTLVILWVIGAPTLVMLYALAGLRVVGSFGEPLRAIYQARSRPVDYVPLRVVTLGIAFVASGLTFLVDGGITWYAGIWGLEWLLFASGLLVLSRRRGLCPPQPRARVQPILWKSSPLFVQSICIAIYMRFDQVYIGWRFGDSDLGIYAAAARIAEAGNMFYGLIALVVGPRLIREWLTGRLSTASRAVLVLVGLGSIAATGLSIPWGGVFLSVVFGPAFGAGGMILAIYLLSTCLTVYGSIGSRLNIAQGTTRPSMVSGLAGAVSNVSLTVVLCEFQGPIGAAMATVMSYLIATGIVWYEIVKFPQHRRNILCPG